MKQIRTLTKIIRIKKAAMNGKRAVLADYFKKESYMSGQVSRLQKLLENNNLLYKNEIISKKPDMRHLERIFVGRSLATEKIELIKKKLSDNSKKIEEIREQITEIHREIKLLTSLKNKKRQRIEENITKAEQKELDEIANIRFLNGFQR